MGHLTETPESVDEAGGLSAPLVSCAVIDSEKSQELITEMGKCGEGCLSDVEEVRAEPTTNSSP